MNAFRTSENFDAFILPLLFPAGKLLRKTPVMHGPILGDQSTVRRKMSGPEHRHGFKQG